MKKASHCDECKHASVKWFLYRGPPAFDVLTCAKKHKPRFYQPKSNPHDCNWGWKRVCNEFETHNVRGKPRRQASA
jgi:hypothetical protein